MAEGGRLSRKQVDFTQAGPGTLGGRLLRRFWQPVFASEDLPRGRAKPIFIMGERFTLYRGQSGAPYVVGFRCAHRSTQLSAGWVRDDNIQCFYHGWTYDGSGACIARPGESPAGPCAEVRIPAYPTREHLGLIYAYFGEGEPPEFPPFPPFEGEGVIENFAIEFPCNWFQTYENQIDEVHVAFVHRGGGSHDLLGRELDLPETSAEETEHGMVRYTRGASGKVRSTLYLFPNNERIIIPHFNGEYGDWRDSYITLVPTDDRNHMLFITRVARVKESEMDAYRETQARFRRRVAESPAPRDLARDILGGKLTIGDVLDHPYIPIVEDAVAQSGQEQIVDRSKEYLGRTDTGIVRMRRLFERELRALAEGKPGKKWRYSGEPPLPGF